MPRSTSMRSLTHAVRSAGASVGVGAVTARGRARSRRLRQARTVAHTWAISQPAAMSTSWSVHVASPTGRCMTSALSLSTAGMGSWAPVTAS